MTTQTYGPFTRCYEQVEWASLPLDQRARYMARQGLSYAISDDVRVVYPPKEDEQDDVNMELVDVPKDGKTVGEVVLRGTMVMKEVRDMSPQCRARRQGQLITLQYFRDPDATRKAFRGGYFSTGDLAVMHSDGYIAIQDRSKDIIISGGEVGDLVQETIPCWLM